MMITGHEAAPWETDQGRSSEGESVMNERSFFHHLKRVPAVMMCFVLSAFLLGACGSDSPKPVTGGGSTSDEMWNELKTDQTIDIYVYDGRNLTLDGYSYDIGNVTGEALREGGFYRLKADVNYINGGVAGYVDYPEIKAVHSCEEVSPLDLNLPSITEKRYGILRIGDYAEGDVFRNEFGRMAVWKDGEWIWHYDKSMEQEDGTLICCRSDVTKEDVLAGVKSGVIASEDYFVLPAIQQ